MAPEVARPAGRTPLVAGNWKMNLTHVEGARLARELLPALPDVPVEVVLCPPFTALAAVAEALAGAAEARRPGLGAQNMHWQAQGAFTGEISAEMLLALGCRYVILGHSERRRLFGETDDAVARKVARAREAGLAPILCVGETLEERRAGRAEDVVTRQLRAALGGDLPDGLVVAYEPVWAIGTGEAASAADAAAMARVIRRSLEETGHPGSGSVRVLYGGSVTPDNAARFFADPDIDGALVGGASLKVAAFAAIVGAAVTP